MSNPYDTNCKEAFSGSASSVGWKNLKSSKHFTSPTSADTYMYSTNTLTCRLKFRLHSSLVSSSTFQETTRRKQCKGGFAPIHVTSAIVDIRFSNRAWMLLGVLRECGVHESDGDENHNHAQKLEAIGQTPKQNYLVYWHCTHINQWSNRTTSNTRINRLSGRPKHQRAQRLSVQCR